MEMFPQTMRPPQVSSTRRWLGATGAVVLGLVLLVAAWTKAIDPIGFAESITAEGLDGLLSARAIVFIALGLEFSLGLALVLNLRRWWILAPAALLVAFFLVLTGRAYLNDLRGIEVAATSCGCFGNLVDRTPGEAFWQDFLLMVPALLLAFLGGRASCGVAWRVGVVAVGTAAGLWLAWRAPELPLDDWATRLSPGTEIAEFCAGRADEPDFVCLDALIPELDEGSHWVVLSHLDEAELISALDRMHEHSLANLEPTLWVVSNVEPEDLNVFSWQYMLATQVRLAPPALMRPLYRTLPRSFRVEGGRVVETIRGVPPLGTTAGLMFEDTGREETGF